MDLEKRIEVLEGKVKALEKNKKDKKFSAILIQIIGWAILIGIVFVAWLHIKPLIDKYNKIAGQISGVTNTIHKGAQQGNEFIDKINHPIKNIDKFNPF